ncbi:hypothetical protein EBZ37_13335, partial [bacterium]|nr:hypothetical protein [bacterium]
MDLPQYSSLVSETADQLASFVLGLRQWPHSDREIEEELCRPLLGLTGAQWVGALVFPNLRKGYPSQSPGDLERILAKLPETVELPNGSEAGRARQVWTPSHLLLWAPLVAEIQGRRSALGWIAAAYSRSQVPSTEQEWVASQERLLQSIAGHLDHLAVETDLRNQVKVREQFLSIASHELKTPLTSIYGILQLQERMMRSLSWPSEKSSEQERQISFLRLVLRQTERMTE